MKGPDSRVDQGQDGGLVSHSAALVDSRQGVPPNHCNSADEKLTLHVNLY